MNKEELVKNLKNIKLVIGNGFDLYCGMKTSYSNYFHACDCNHKILLEWINSFDPLMVKNYINFRKNIANRNNFWVSFDGFDKANFWNLFFFFVSKDNVQIDKWNWCDIETTMLEWLNSPNDKNHKNTRKSLEYIFRILSNDYYPKDLEKGIFYLTAFVYKKNDEKNFKDLDDFYNFLLLELNKFERGFGRYIHRLQIVDSFSYVSYTRFNIEFNKNKQLDTLNKLGLTSNYCSIDSFNFSSIYLTDDPKREFAINHINGDYEAPIFGVDSSAFAPNDPRYIFTKTYRRMSLDSNRNDAFERQPFSNIIIFGSSLGKADYSYFFSIFDKINIVDLSNDSKIVFAFNVYDRNDESKIKQDLFKNIFDLFYEYSIYKGNNVQPNRLLDALTTQGKVILYEL